MTQIAEINACPRVTHRLDLSALDCDLVYVNTVLLFQLPDHILCLHRSENSLRPRKNLVHSTRKHQWSQSLQAMTKLLQLDNALLLLSCLLVSLMM